MSGTQPPAQPSWMWVIPILALVVSLLAYLLNRRETARKAPKISVDLTLERRREKDERIEWINRAGLSGPLLDPFVQRYWFKVWVNNTGGSPVTITEIGLWLPFYGKTGKYLRWRGRLRLEQSDRTAVEFESTSVVNDFVRGLPRRHRLAGYWRTITVTVRTPTGAETHRLSNLKGFYDSVGER